ncbi:HAD-IIA family hydrolase [Ktedonosporobacter rubrisoli]|uniref:HAD-IIA family hydrolase n=1 Tax=Ktedonosporobacter rubrisoli TaxID=2509675 RepID=A0A4P6JNN7_KTERU|nr:HAD-IIA family hydrolase [Ktedonosporobacter rubrisoli]QBD76928.1 HAD-IIA family hydrolase [Ktedonosporobacter rubrisoli]
MLADQFDAFFFDMDGVIYVGRQVLAHVIPSLERLRSLGKSIRFLTNNPCPTRDGLISRLQHMGIEAYKEEMFTSSWATCLYLQQQGIRKVYPIGSADMLLEMAELGISATNEDPEAVVVGCESDIDYEQLKWATRFIRQGVHFVATMVDAWFPDEGGPSPATGAVISALQTSTERFPLIIGKPAPTMFHEAQLGLPHIDKSRILMIGDNPMSDILGAHRAGLTAMMISQLSEGTRLYPGAHDLRQPDGYIPNLAALFDPDYTVRKWEPVSYDWPQRVVPAVAAIVRNSDGEVLLLRREGEAWQVPLGMVGPGETVEEAVCREVEMQTGLQVSVQRLCGLYSEPETQVMTLPSGEVVHGIVNCFICEVVRKRSAPPAETSLRFADPQNPPEPFSRQQRHWLSDMLSQNVVVR